MSEACVDDHHRLYVEKKDAGKRVDVFLNSQLPEISRARIQKYIQCGRVLLDGQRVQRRSAKVSEGMSVDVARPLQQQEEGLRPSDLSLDILYEDAFLIVINKPAGMVVHPAPGHQQDTLVNALLAHCGPSFKHIGEADRPGIVHRLDKDTSGILVVAKTQQAYQKLTQAFAKRAIKRIYTAFCWGVPTPASGVYEGDIGRDPYNRKRMAVVCHGRWAATSYKTQKAFAGTVAARMACSLKTGRTHQIRVHFASHHHPLIGDPLYLKRTPAYAKKLKKDIRHRILQFPRQALHASTLSFIHPMTGEQLHFETPLPEDMQQLQALLTEV